VCAALNLLFQIVSQKDGDQGNRTKFQVQNDRHGVPHFWPILPEVGMFPVLDLAFY
jgi:hypothetical protein